MDHSCIEGIDKQIRESWTELNMLQAAYRRLKRNLIVSTGDISDVDGFYALAHYASTGADVLFIMNYPAYFRFEGSDEIDARAFGLGYRYGPAFFFQYTHLYLDDSENNDMVDRFRVYSTFLNRFKSIGKGQVNAFKRALTGLAFSLAKQVWDEATAGMKSKGSLYFGIGGVNEINPFSHLHLKNEIFVYSSVFTDGVGSIKASGLVRRKSLAVDSNTEVSCLDILDGRESIYIDFNGSMAFLDSFWEQKLCEVGSCIKGVFVLGGVFADALSQTIPSVKGTLNRLTCATMNQMYAPSRTAAFFRLMASIGVPVFVVPNNSVQVLDKDKVHSFLRLNLGHFIVLDKMADLYYNSMYHPPVKPFDFYTALALVSFLRDGTVSFKPSKLFFDAVYGVSIICSTDCDWDEAAATYIGHIRESESYSKNMEAYDTEAKVLSTLNPYSITVSVLEFTMISGRLSLARNSE